jgi:hypothetical protein
VRNDAGISLLSRIDKLHASKGYANDWLTEEFRARAGKKRKLILVDRLSAALKLVDIKVTPAEVTSESNVLKLRRRVAMPQLSRSGFSSEQQIISYRDECMRLTGHGWCQVSDYETMSAWILQKPDRSKPVMGKPSHPAPGQLTATGHERTAAECW